MRLVTLFVLPQSPARVRRARASQPARGQRSMDPRVVTAGRRWSLTAARPQLALAVAALALASCTTPLLQEGLRDDPELIALLEAYRKANERAAVADAPVPGMRRLEVAKGAAPTDALVSLDLERAPVGPVVLRVLEGAGLPYAIEGPRLRGTVTVRLDRVPVMRALNEVLASQGLGATLREGVVVVGDDGGADPPAPAGAAAAVTTAQVALTHLDKEAVTALLQGLVQRDPTAEDAGLRFSAQPYTNTVFLVGSPANVRRATRLLRQADQDPDHVVIEALLVEIDSNALEELGTDLNNFKNEQFYNLATTIGRPGFPGTLIFSYLEGGGGVVTKPGEAGAGGALGRSRQYTAIINLLVQRGKARVIARPHLAALSGRKARIEISEDRYITVQTATQGTTVATTQPVQGGVILDITPNVTRDGRVRMGLSVEQSTFIDQSVANITTAVDKNKAETTMEVTSGQAILIGGLTQHLRSSVSAGLPWLRHIPILNLVFARFQAESRRQELLVYITPHIWRPGLDSPIPEPKAFGPKEPRDDFSTIERFGR